MRFSRFIKLFILVTLIFLLAGCGQQPVVKARKAKRKVSQEELLPATYEIAKTQDASYKATTKPIAAYTPEKLAALPMAKKFVCKVLVPGSIKETQVKPTIYKIIGDLTEQDKDLDEIELYIFANREALNSSDVATEFASTFEDTSSYRDTVNSKYDVAYARWRPGPMTGLKVTPELATSNNREDYETDIKIRENLTEYLEQKETFREDFALTEEDKKALFVDIMATKDKANDEAFKAFPNDAKQAEKKRAELLRKYYYDVRAKHVVSDDIIEEVEAEGTSLGWPTK